MKKIGLFINSTITVADFEKIAKPFLGNEEIELFYHLPNWTIRV